MLITTRKLERELNISLKRNTKFQNLFEIFFLAAESKCKMFHFLSIMHTWTDFATFRAIEQHVPWIFWHSPLDAQDLQCSFLSWQADGKK